MVLGVCRRVLGNHHDAEDAFQATFLVLVRKAASIVPRDKVANWLYGVAYRTALKARTRSARHRVRERQMPEIPEPEAVEQDAGWRELRPMLDEELRRLPEKYRIPIVLCNLEGKTGKEAAQHLAWAEGTVSSRLARGRALLAKRLARRGLAVSDGTLAIVLSHHATSGGVPASLVSATIKAASFLAAGQAVTTGLISAPVAALTKGVLQAMFLNKLKTALVLCAVIGAVGTGVGGVSFRAAANDDPAAKNRRQQVAPADGRHKEKPGQANSILSSDDLRGNWTGEKNGIKVDLTFYGEQARWQAHWQVEFRVFRKPEFPGQSPTMGYTAGAELRCVADVKAGCLNLYLPRYLGDNKERKQNPSFNGLRPVGQVQRGAKGTIELRIIPTSIEDVANKLYDYPAVEGLILRRVADEKKAPEKDQAKQTMDMVLKGYQAYWDSKENGKAPPEQDLAKLLWDMMEKSYRPPGGKKVGPAEKEALLDASRQAFLIAWQVASELAKGKTAPGAKRPTEEESPAEEDLAKLLWEMMEKAYRPPDGKQAGPADKEALDLYGQAFLKGFQFSSEIARAMGKGQAKVRPEPPEAFDALAPAFVQAYERARALRKTLQEQKAAGAKGEEKALEALDVFLKAGEQFEQAIKQGAKKRAVQQARREIENALNKVEKATHDRRTELEALDEIEKAVKAMKKKIQDKQDEK
jgi:RNA polymerase sigma factor (sigma-70 family)